MTRYEYKIVPFALRPEVDELNEHGQDGWELVCVEDLGINARAIVTIWKRPEAPHSEEKMT
jgi:hypothetical protein